MDGVVFKQRGNSFQQWRERSKDTFVTLTEQDRKSDRQRKIDAVTVGSKRREGTVGNGQSRTELSLFLDQEVSLQGICTHRKRSYP